MKLSRKAGLSIIAAVVLVGAVNVATAVGASGFLAESYVKGGSGGVELKGASYLGGVKGSKNTLQILGTSLECVPPNFSSAKQHKPSTALSAETYLYEKCYGPNGESSFLKMNGCKLIFQPGERLSASTLGGTFSIGPPGCGPITTELFYGACLVSIDPSAGFEATARYENSGEGSKSLVNVFAEAHKLHYSAHGTACNTSGEEGSYAPSWAVSAYGEAGETVGLNVTDELPFGVFLTGAEKSPKLEAESYPLSLSSGGVVTYTMPTYTMTCKDSALAGELTAATATQSLNASYSECTTTVSGTPLPTLVAMNSCHYNMNVGSSGSKYTGTLGVSCTTEGAAIEISYYTSETYQTRLCKIKLPAQSAHSGMTLTNSGTGTKRAVGLEAKVEGISYEKSGLCGTGTGTGTLSSTSTLAGVAEPPDTTITSGPKGTIYSPETSFSMKASQPGSSFQCSLDGAAFSACESPKSYSGLTEGTHLFKVRAVYVPGNRDETPAERSFTVGPETTINSPMPSYTSGPPGPVEFSANQPGATFKCSLDNAKEEATTSCTSPYTLPKELSSGWHTVVVQATGAKGIVDPTPAKWKFNTDIYPPGSLDQQTGLSAGRRQDRQLLHAEGGMGKHARRRRRYGRDLPDETLLLERIQNDPRRMRYRWRRQRSQMASSRLWQPWTHRTGIPQGQRLQSFRRRTGSTHQVSRRL